jgi:hypothetical protein
VYVGVLFAFVVDPLPGVNVYATGLKFWFPGALIGKVVGLTFENVPGEKE